MTDDNAGGDASPPNPDDSLEAALDEAVAFAQRQWRENPVGVLAAAAGLGFLVGLLLGQRR